MTSFFRFVDKPLMSPSFKNRKIGIGKPNKKNLAPHICEFALIKRYAYKKNNLILLFFLICKIAILPHLSGNVKNVNSLFDLFWE